ncbi:MAG TPA: right-handed parallel beta-helix repeat-containing protein [Coleofasciculaceae cyanobacterium]
MFRKISILSFVVLLFLALLLPAHGNVDKPETNFYVALNGSDSNPGTFDKPWVTINHAADVLKAGETVYIRGGTYRINQQIVAKNSGTEKAWIVYSSYPGEQAIIDASDVKVGPPVGTPPFPHDQGAFQVERVSYIRLNNLKLTNSHSAGFTVRDSHHIKLYNNTASTTYSSGIAVWCSNNLGRGCEHNKVIGNTVIKANTYDMIMPGFDRGEETPHEALSVGDIYYFEIAYNHIYDCDKEGIDVKGSSKHGTVHHNHIHNLARQGLYVDNWGDSIEDIEVYENVVHDSKGAGIALSVEGGKLTNDIKIHHNFLYNNLGTGIFFSRWGDDGVKANIKIYNNTVHHNGYGKPKPEENYYWMTGGLYLFSKNVKNIEIKNNIFSDNKGFQIGYSDHYLKIDNDVNVVFQKNNINIGYNLLVDNNKVEYPIYVGWPPDSYANVYSTKGSNFVEKNPLFVDTQSENFYLNSNSPALDKGSPESTYTDPDGTRNDIGAFYYGAERNLWWKTNFPPHFNLGTSKN